MIHGRVFVILLLLDSIQIADSIGPLSVLCGTGSAPPGETRTNVMFVQFISNNVVSRTGFNMTYVQERSKLNALPTILEVIIEQRVQAPSLINMITFNGLIFRLT